MAATVEELEEGLRELQKNLAEIEELLAADPDDQDVQAMKQDVTNEIADTAKTIEELKTKAAAAAASHNNDHHDANNNDGAGGSAAGVPLAPESAAALLPALPAAVREFEVSDVVNVFSAGFAKVAEVLQIQGDNLVVRHLGVGETRPTLAAKTTCQLVPTSHALHKGQRVQAASKSTNTWADGVVDDVDGFQVLVRFVSGKQRGETEWMHAARIQQHALASAPRGEQESAVKPNRQTRKMDKKRVQKQSDWQQFAKKNKRVKRSVSDSMFRSPESDKGKVGVVGSGKEMTGKFDTRPKFSKTGS